MNPVIQEELRQLAFGEFNDETTRNKVVSFLHKKYPDSLIECSSRLNPPNLIDQGKLSFSIDGQIYVIEGNSGSIGGMLYG